MNESHLFDLLQHLASLVGRQKRVVANELQTVGEVRWRHVGQTVGGPGSRSYGVQDLTGRNHRSR